MATGQLVLIFAFASIAAAYPQYLNHGVYYHPHYPVSSAYSTPLHPAGGEFNPNVAIPIGGVNPLYPFGDRLQTNSQGSNVEVEAFHVKVVQLPAIDSVASFDFDAARKSKIPTALDEVPPTQGNLIPKIDDRTEDALIQPTVTKTLDGRIGDVPKPAEEIKPIEDNKPEETTKTDKTKKRGDKEDSKKREGKKVIKKRAITW